MATSLKAQFQDFNLELVSNVSADVSVNDIWGFQHTNGIEYAIMGTQEDVRIFSLEDPTDPRLVYSVEGSNTTWRDMKTLDDYIYVIADNANDGLLVIDMTDPGQVDHEFTFPDGLRDGHNIFIDERGYLYVAGGELGGLVIFDLNVNKYEPPLIGSIGTYAHDVYVQDDILFHSAIFVGELRLYDVSDPTSPEFLSNIATSFEFTHNAWSSGDNNYVFTTDERENAFVDAIDISDPQNPRIVDRIRTRQVNDNVIPHNAHYHNGFLIVSWYGDGVIVIDAHRPENLIITGSYDTSESAVSGFNGCWGAFPFLPSGLVLASDRGNGLFVLRPNYTRASYLEGIVTDASTGAAINGATVDILSSANHIQESTNSSGEYKTGIVDVDGVYEVRIEKEGYIPKVENILFEAGEVAILNCELVACQAEICDGIDNNCDGQIDEGLTYTDYYPDTDNDGFGADVMPTSACSSLVGYVTNNMDCNDGDANINPEADEACNGSDDNCDGEVDEGLVYSDYYPDTDNDGYGEDVQPTSLCSPQTGFADNNLDCNDRDASINPDSNEACNGLDDNCDGAIDEGLVFIEYFPDGDNDGYGAGDEGILDCRPLAGHSTSNDDCDDDDPLINPGMSELCDGKDNNCNGEIDEDFVLFNPPTLSCLAVSSQSIEISWDTNSSSSTYHIYIDGNYTTSVQGNMILVEDLEASTTYTVRVDIVFNNGCMTLSSEIACATLAVIDADGDGFNSDEDCNDNDPDVFPGNTEICDDKDNDCNGSIDEGLDVLQYFRDGDDDGFGTQMDMVEDCNQPIGYVLDSGDCDDDNPDVNPDAAEICDDIDNDCNSLIDEGLAEAAYYLDADGDGYGAEDNSVIDCALPSGYVENADDCDDTNAGVNPEATEIPNNGIDEDCDGEDLVTSVIDTEDFKNLKIYPNPATNTVFIETDKGDAFNISVYNSMGSEISRIFESNSFSVEDFSQGVYFVSIRYQGAVTTKKLFVIQD